MANYVKVEIFIPVEYKKEGKPISANLDEFEPLLNKLNKKYGGCTTHNIHDNPPYTGYYYDKRGIVVDTLTSVVVLVKKTQVSEAIKYFKKLKENFEQKFEQDFVLITYHSIQTIGTL